MAKNPQVRRPWLHTIVRVVAVAALVAGLRVASPLAGSGTFAADGPSLGAIPDGTALSNLPAYGAARNVTFSVTGLAGTVSSVVVSFSASHTFVGDIEVVLIAPDGTHTLPLFARTGATSTSSFGSGSDLLSANTYSFDDTATTNWWTRVATNPVPGGLNRTTAPGPDATPPADVTSLNAAFAGASPNGTWTLRFRDGTSADTGMVANASITVNTTGGGPTAVDFDGDHKTDYAVVRNTGGGANGQITWFLNNSTAGFSAVPWGLSGDFFVPGGDYDGDGKTDITVWRAGPPGFFYVRQSSNGALLAQQWGTGGDDPTVPYDYDGDGLTDFAVYRAGANAGQPSTWYARKSSNGSLLAQVWGQNGDFPAPGDFDGDGKGDFTVQRNNGGGGAAFYQLLTTAGFKVSFFGTPTDVIVPGDYDGDGKTDIAVLRGSAGQYAWYVLRSSDAQTQSGLWGSSSTDFPTQGDYDGDGKTDFAVWRPSATPGQSGFWVMKSSGGFSFFQWGQNGDYPPANYNRH